MASILSVSVVTATHIADKVIYGSSSGSLMGYSLLISTTFIYVNRASWLGVQLSGCEPPPPPSPLTLSSNSSHLLPLCLPVGRYSNYQHDVRLSLMSSALCPSTVLSASYLKPLSLKIQCPTSLNSYFGMFRLSCMGNPTIHKALILV